MDKVRGAAPVGTLGRGGFAFEAPAPRGYDSVYVSDGAGEPYSAGRGETDNAFQYYSRHPLPRVGAPTGRPGTRAAAEAPPAASAQTAARVPMTCMRCHGSECMYRSPAEEPFCVDCNRAALQR